MHAVLKSILLSGILITLPQSATANSAQAEEPEHMTLSPIDKPFTSLPKLITSPENSIPTIVPDPPEEP